MEQRDRERRGEKGRERERELKRREKERTEVVAFGRIPGRWRVVVYLLVVP